MAAVRHFLIVYDRRTGHLRELKEFAGGERARALQERFSRERELMNDPHIEVVLLAAESRADAERTHGRYFKSIAEIASVA